KSKVAICGPSNPSAHGIIRQIYGPPQRRRRYVIPRVQREESVIERTVAELQEQALERRREVYRRHLFVKHMGANRISGYQQITPETFKLFPRRIEKLTPWIRRELNAIFSLSGGSGQFTSTSSTQHSYTASGASVSLTPSSSSSSSSSSLCGDELTTGLEIIREYITAVLKRYDLQTDQAQDLLQDFLHEHTGHFVHELMGFARSPLSMDAYDKVAQYGFGRDDDGGDDDDRQLDLDAEEQE
ncbi:hypothetical protein BG004_001159, partial [Podila humilis]